MTKDKHQAVKPLVVNDNHCSSQTRSALPRSLSTGLTRRRVRDIQDEMKLGGMSREYTPTTKLTRIFESTTGSQRDEGPTIRDLSFGIRNERMDNS